MARTWILLVCLIVVSACGGGGSPAAPTSTPPPAPTFSQLPTPEIASFSVTGQRVLGQYRYWPEMTMRAGSSEIVITSVTFALTGVDAVGGALRMTRALAAGTNVAFGRAQQVELVASAAATQAVVTVGYTNRDGESQQVTSVAEVPTVPVEVSRGVLAITRFTVDQWTEQGGDYAYWPRLTLTEGSGLSAVTVTRVQFTLLDVGAFGRVPTHPGGWAIGAGSSRDIFHDVAYGEPAFYISSSRLSGRVEVTISYVDDAGRAADVSAIATVEPLRAPL